MSPRSAEDLSLNKRQVLSGLRCRKLLWWMHHESDAPELRYAPETLVRFMEGRVTDEFAQRFMGDGVQLSAARGFDPSLAAEATQTAMSREPQRMFQPTFVAEGAAIRADAVERSGDRWALVEVKSAKSPRDKRDRKKKIEDYQADIAVQVAVMRAAGVPVEKSQLMLLNRHFQHPDVGELFVREDVTAEANAVAAQVMPEVANLLQTLHGPLPDVSTGDQCTDPERCPFYDRCHPKLPDHHVSELYYAKKHAAKFESQGRSVISALDESDAPNEPARRQIRAVKSGRRVVEEGLRAAIEGLAQPIAFLDFETVQLAVPRWAGCRPQDMVAVQFSVHREGFADNTTREYLAAPGGDPRAPMIEPLIEACAGARTVLVYFEAFEKARLEELAEWFPQHRTALMDIHARIVDLLPIVRDHVYDPGFRGSFSLKKVLPALVPDLDYSDLRIQQGELASTEIYRLLFDERLGGEEAAALRSDLLAYCRRDTEAMVRLLGVLRSIAT